jgi:hypothetical protein
MPHALSANSARDNGACAQSMTSRVKHYTHASFAMYIPCTYYHVFILLDLGCMHSGNETALTSPRLRRHKVLPALRSLFPQLELARDVVPVSLLHLT